MTEFLKNNISFFKGKLIRVIALLLLVFLFSTCKKDHMMDCFTSTGKEISEYRTAGWFSHVNMKDHVDLVIRKTSGHYIKVTAGSHLIDGIITELDNGTLYIRNENKCNWVRSFKNKYTVEIGVDSLQTISTYGNGSISCPDSLTAYEFTFDSWNASGSIDLLLNCERSHLNNNTGRIDMRASGKAGVSYIAFNDVATLDAGKLISDAIYMRNNSTGDIRVCAKSELNVEIRYTGNIYYTGNPLRIHEDITGSGRLIPY